jgi:hypothetical protein
MTNDPLLQYFSEAEDGCFHHLILEGTHNMITLPPAVGGIQVMYWGKTFTLTCTNNICSLWME